MGMDSVPMDAAPFPSMLVFFNERLLDEGK